MRPRRLLLVLLVAGLMSAWGLGTYQLLGHLKVSTASAPAAPTRTQTLVALPGTIYLAQDGLLYRLRGRRFTQVTAQARGWMQPALTPDGHLVAVSRSDASSDLYLLDADGSVVAQLTHDAAPPRAPLEENHWAFYPRVTADGSTVYYAYDAPKAGFRVDLAIWSRSLRGSGAPRRWTTPEGYTGGDVEPLPLADGGLVYVADTIDKNDRIVAQIMLLTPAGRQLPLTTPEQDCSWPALSPDGRTMAMVCSFAALQTAVLEVASFDGVHLGPMRPLVSDQLCAAPAWAPDGGGLAYLAPAATGTGFQLWWLPKAASATPGRPQQVTEGLALDATSPPAWR